MGVGAHFGSLGVRVRYQTAAHLDAVEELFRLRPRQVGEAPPLAADSRGSRGVFAGRAPGCL